MARQQIQEILTQMTPQDTSAGNVFMVARQPIFDQVGAVYAYELLFRDPLTQGFGGKNSHAATSSVMMDGLELMRPSLRGGQRFFINFTEEMLEAELAAVLPPSICVIEVLETVQPTKNVLRGLNNLKKNGYMLALDDYVGQPHLRDFLPLMDVVKVEVLGRSKVDILKVINPLRKLDVKMLAEKVEDRAMANVCRDLGFSLFQGFFYSKAEVLRGKKLTPSQVTKTRLLAFSTRDLDNLDEVVNAISGDVFLTYRLLKYVNSAFFGLPVQVTNVHHAIMLLGRVKLMQWICVTTLAEMDNAPMSREIVYISALRAKFLELLAETRKLGKDAKTTLMQELFMLGLFSLLEGLLHMPWREILLSVPVNDGVARALASGEGPLAPWRELMENYEQGNWERAHELAASLELPVADLATTYAEASKWSLELFSLEG